MANEELSQFTELAETPAVADLFGVVDVSDTTDAATGTTKKNKAQYAIGAQVNAQTGTTYTYLTTDFRKLVTHSNGSAIAGTLPQASASFPAGWFMFVQNRGAGTLTITPTTSTIDGAATLVLNQNEGAIIVSDGTNYFTLRGKATGAAGVGDVVGPSSATDNALARFDTTTGKLIQDSTVTLDDTGALTVPEMVAPSTPAAGKVSVYAKSDGHLYIKDDAGTETDLASGGGGSVNPTDTVMPYNNAGTFADSHLTRSSTTVTTITAGALRGPNGSASAPTFSFTNSPGSGLWSDASTTLRISANGGAQVQLIRDSSTRSRLLLNASGNGAMFGFGSDTSLDAGLYRPAQGHVAVTSDAADPTPTPGTLYSPTNALGTFGSELVVNMQLGNIREFTLDNNYTMRAPSNARAGTILVIRLKQDATGSRTVTWNSAYKWAGGSAPTLTTAANAVDLFMFYLDGTNAEELERKLDVK